MTSHRFRYFSIGLGLGATVGLLLATRPSGNLAGSDAIPADRPDARLAGGAADFEGGTAASTEDVPVSAARGPRIWRAFGTPECWRTGMPSDNAGKPQFTLSQFV